MGCTRSINQQKTATAAIGAYRYPSLPPLTMVWTFNSVFRYADIDTLTTKIGGMSTAGERSRTCQMLFCRYNRRTHAEQRVATV